MTLFTTLAFVTVAIYVEFSAGVVIFDDSVGLERQFDGIGGLSGGGVGLQCTTDFICT